MYTCKNCGNKIEKEKKNIHDVQECKGFEGLDPPGEDTVFAMDYFNELNKETNTLEEDEKLAKKLQEEYNKDFLEKDEEIAKKLDKELNKRFFEKKKVKIEKINDNHNEVENRDLNFFNKDIKEKDNNKVKEDKKILYNKRREKSADAIINKYNLKKKEKANDEEDIKENEIKVKDNNNHIHKNRNNNIINMQEFIYKRPLIKEKIYAIINRPIKKNYVSNNINNRRNNNNIRHFNNHNILNNQRNRIPNRIHNFNNNHQRNNELNLLGVDEFGMIIENKDKPIKKELLKDLPIITLKNIDNLDDEKKLCYICLQDYIIEDKVFILPCFHIFILIV
jgi:hypothetical protein